MKKIKFVMCDNDNFYYSEELKFEDDISKSEIEEELNLWKDNIIECWWEEV